MAEQRKPAAKRPPRRKPTSAVEFSIWQQDGTTLPESAIQAFEDAIEATRIKLFNQGIRTLTQTTRG